MLNDFFKEEEVNCERRISGIDESISGTALEDAGYFFDSFSPYKRPFYLNVSGTYKNKRYLQKPGLPNTWDKRLPKLELRLDVDGRYPQMAASGVIQKNVFTKRAHWIADLKPQGWNQWAGKIWFAEGDERSFPYRFVEINVNKTTSKLSYADLTFLDPGRGQAGPFRLNFTSPYFRSVEFEYDVVQGSDKITEYNTHAHPNRPADLTSETLTVETVYQRAGFNVSKTNEDDVVPISISGNNIWSDMELHNAMQSYWSKYADVAQWSMWTVFAGIHSGGAAGIMFDDIGPNHRQGTAVFSDNSLFNAAPGDPADTAFRDRYIFWCACHEMGHCFNLAHSWQKELGNPWCNRLKNEPDALSFMNYPFYYPVGYMNSYGTDDYFSNFMWRFSDQELLFLRHAPEQYVQMGNAEWFDDHGFHYAETATHPDLKLELRLNRDKPVFEFLETVAVEFKLSNISCAPQTINGNILKMADNAVIVIKKEGRATRQFIPFAQLDFRPEKKVLQPGKSIYEALQVSTGLNGWDLSEPGNYLLQVILKLESGEDLVSNRLHLRILPPKNFEEEHVAQDYFTEDVGRVLFFEGAPQLVQANNTLLDLVERMPECRAAVLARYALVNPVAMDFKELHMPDDLDPLKVLSGQGVTFKTNNADYMSAKAMMSAAVNEKMNEAADTLGHIRYRKFAENFARKAALAGDVKTAEDVTKRLHNTLRKRNVLDSVLEKVKSLEKSFSA